MAYDTQKVPTVQKWLNVISSYNGEFKKWEARTVKIIRRYRDDLRNSGTTGYEAARFNILWSNVQTLVPAVFSRLPKADVSRRFSDNDPVGRVASLLIERALDYEIEHYPDFRAAMKNAVEDRFLGGRGVAWVRYDPHIKKQDMPENGWQITEDVEEEDYGDIHNQTAGMEEEPEEIEYECAPTDYVHWKDFGHTPARTWEEVTAVWRWVYMSREALIERFGEEAGRKIPTNESPEGLTKYGQTGKTNDKAKICELWDKETGKVYWLNESTPELLDEKDDPLDLEGFFPCAKPLYATTTTDNLIPIPDFILYQDQANELDILTDRIDGLIKALRVRGIYDASQPALQRLLTEGDNNTLIPTDKWMSFSEKGGLKGSIDLLPLDTIASTLIQCYQAQSNVKGQIYEITGISDIIRGQSAASETATAQQIKGQYAGLRLGAMQEGVAMFATELLRLKAQIICDKFQPETILAYAAAQQMSPEDQQLIPQAMELLKSEPLRAFRIEVASDSLVKLDEQQNKQERMEFIGAFSNFLREAVTAGQQVPELTPLIMQVLKFGVAGFKAGRQIEGTIDVAMQQLVQNQAQAKANPQPDPEAAKMQMEQQAAQMELQAKMQMEQAKGQADMQVEQMKAQMTAQLEQSRQQHEAQLKMQELATKEQFDRWKADLDAATKIMVARISSNPGADIPLLEVQQAAADTLTNDLGDSVRNAMGQMAEAHNNMANMHGESMQKLHETLQALSAPKRIIRGPDGRAVGVEPIQQMVN
jgi:F0F1-type ATP synthase membrane subunit b/b'